MPIKLDSVFTYHYSIHQLKVTVKYVQQKLHSGMETNALNVKAKLSSETTLVKSVKVQLQFSMLVQGLVLDVQRDYS